MSNAQLPEDQLFELLLQLRKATPDQARSILNSQPHVSYGLIGLMVKINAINVEVFQTTLAKYGQQNGNGSASIQLPPSQPAPPVPPHMNPPQNRGDAIQYSTPPPGLYSQPRPQPTSGFPPYTNGPPLPPSQPNIPVAPAPAPYAPPGLSDALATMSEEQRIMIMRIVSMTPEQISQLPPTERANVIQLRATLGIS